MASQKITLKKIALEEMVFNLVELYEKGVDFIDMEIEVDDVKQVDTIKVTFTTEYLCEEAKIEQLSKKKIDITNRFKDRLN